MSIILIILAAAVVGGVVGVAIALGIREDKKNETSAEKIGAGLDERNKAIQNEKDSKKKQILELLAKQDNITNNDAQKTLKISDATATRYLDELEAEGKIQAVGDSAREIKYRLKHV